MSMENNNAPEPKNDVHSSSQDEDNGKKVSHTDTASNKRKQDQLQNENKESNEVQKQPHQDIELAT